MLDSSDELITTPIVTVPPSNQFVVLSQTHQTGTPSSALPPSTKLPYLTSLSTPADIVGSSRSVANSNHSASSPLPSHILNPISTASYPLQELNNLDSAHIASLARPSWKPKHDLHRNQIARPNMTVTPLPNSSHPPGPSASKPIVNNGHSFYDPNGASHTIAVDRIISSKLSNLSSTSSASSPSSITISAARPKKFFPGRTSDKSLATSDLNGSRLSSKSRLTGPVFRLSKALRLSHPKRLIMFGFALIICLLSVTFVIRYFSTSSLTNLRATLYHGFVAGGRQVWFTSRRYARRLLHDYQRLLHIYPLASRAISAGIIFFFANLIAQFLNRPKQRPFSSTYSFRRNFWYSVYGLTLMGPLLYVWYGLMHRYGPPDTLRGSVQKALIENFTLEPGCIIIYVVYDAIVYQRPFSYVKRTIRTHLFPVWVNQCVFWFPANFSNYYIGTPDMRVIFSNLCSLLWNIYFSAKTSRWSSSNQGPAQVPPSVSTKSVPV